MTDVIGDVLTTAGWVVGVVVLLVMALLPVLDRYSTPDGRR